MHLNRVRARISTSVLLLALLAMTGVQASVVLGRAGRDGGPSPALGPILVAPSAVSAARKLTKPAAPAARSAAPAAAAVQAESAAVPDLSAFRGLGAWVDLYDFSPDPSTAVAAMRARGVNTLYIQTGRYNTRGQIAYASVVARWLAAAHAVGMKVVGWYLPAYGRFIHRDVARSVAVARFSAYRQKFDALGIDIEWRNAVPSAVRWSRQVVSHLGTVRNRLGRSYPIAAIVPPPLQMRLAPGYWRGFRWADVGHIADVIVPMAYWSTRSGCPRLRNHCAYGYTTANIRAIRRLTGDPNIPIHMIGGIGDAVSAREVSEFVRAINDAGAIGGSLYDFFTTSWRFWGPLSRLAKLL